MRVHVTIFKRMIDEFEDIREDILAIADQREQMRLEQLENNKEK